MVEFLVTAACLFVILSWVNSWMTTRRNERLGRQEAARDKQKARARLRQRLGREPTEDEVYNELWCTRDESLRD